MTLHFAEIYYHAAGERLFDVAIEGKEVLKGYDPFGAGFATADRRAFEIEVLDGFLDIEFVPRTRNPKVSAIEVERS